ncbi:MAG TPA: hypothetical protein VJ761_16945 [Ktedonobacteraceae bacterium]|nr:hypothetical protein [Ktedonobacteraceae bacterium]
MSNQGTQFYTASEAQARLGLSKAQFHQKVRQGVIPKVVMPGRKQGVYPRRDIDALALSMSSDLEENVFSRSTPADQVEEMSIDIRYSGRNFVTSLAERIAFQQKCSFTFHSLKVGGKVVGYISMFRLPDSFLEDMLTGRKIEQEISLREVLPFVRLEPFAIFLDKIAVDLTLPLHLRRFYAGIIIFHFIGVLLNLLTNDYQITQLYAVATTQEANTLLKKLGFQYLAGKSVVPGRSAYEYRLDSDGLSHLQALHQAFRHRL